MNHFPLQNNKKIRKKKPSELRDGSGIRAFNQICCVSQGKWNDKNQPENECDEIPGSISHGLPLF